MKFFADLHVHSHFSRATSKNMDIEHLHAWAQLKGLTVTGTGDCTHPGWLEEISARLEPDDNGLYKLKKEYLGFAHNFVPHLLVKPVRFIVTGEISTIYKKNGQTRKIHHVVLLPTIEDAVNLSGRLEKNRQYTFRRQTYFRT